RSAWVYGHFWTQTVCRDRVSSISTCAACGIRVECASSTLSRARSFVWARRHREYVGGLRSCAEKARLVVREDPATVAVAKSIIELAKRGRARARATV